MMLRDTGMENISKFILAAIFKREIKGVKKDKATMDYYICLTNFYSQYQAVGVNYNQIVKALRTNFSEKRAIALLYKLEKATIELVTISKMVFQLTKEYDEKWLKK